MDAVSSFFDAILSIDNDAELHKRMAGKDKKGNVLADRLIERLLALIIPVNVEQQNVIKDRMEIQKTRPALSMNALSQNTVLLNSRLTSTFMVFDNVIRFFNWYNPYLTIGVCLVMTHLILNPYLVSVLPLVLLINNVLIPHYLVVHPPDRSVLKNNPYPDDGPALARYKIPAPVPQFSQEYVLNFTDMQNHMVYFVYAYDFVMWLTNDYLYFKNEDLSSLVYLVLLGAIGCNLYMVPKVVPVVLEHFWAVQLVAVAYVWLVALVSYPQNRTTIFNKLVDEQTRLTSLNYITTIENKLISRFLVSVAEDTGVRDLVKQTEVFELQKYSQQFKIWEPVGFTNDFYSINHPLRQLHSHLFEDDLDDDGLIQEAANVYVKRAPSLKQVLAPPHWQYMDTSWALDLQPHMWVEHNLINDMVNIDNDEKWVYDYYNEDFNELLRRRRWIRFIKRDNKLKRKTTPTD